MLPDQRPLRPARLLVRAARGFSRQLSSRSGFGYTRGVAKEPKFAIASVQPVGRYALGVTWGDKHDSIYPFTNLRRLCPCIECAPGVAPAAEPARLEHLHRLGDASVLLSWSDGHETLFLVEELREICGCALCKGEPTYPITNQ